MLILSNTSEVSKDYLNSNLRSTSTSRSNNNIAPLKNAFFLTTWIILTFVLHVLILSNTSDVSKDYLNSNLRYHRQFWNEQYKFRNKTNKIQPNSFMRYFKKLFNNDVNKSIMSLWKFLQLNCSFMYPCLHGSSPSMYKIDKNIILQLKKWRVKCRLRKPGARGSMHVENKECTPSHFASNKNFSSEITSTFCYSEDCCGWIPALTTTYFRNSLTRSWVLYPKPLQEVFVKHICPGGNKSKMAIFSTKVTVKVTRLFWCNLKGFH